MLVKCAVLDYALAKVVIFSYDTTQGLTEAITNLQENNILSSTIEWLGDIENLKIEII